MANRRRTATPGPPGKPLADYARKRDFARTPEPVPEESAGSGARFVVQKHAARRLHFDLRLELDGVLKSWAVTRGPSLGTGEKRLAVRTEDHPVEYLTFEGNIPKGQYGGGSMIVWDRGRWLPQADPRQGLKKGHLEFVLEGARLKGRWHLVRLRPRAGEKTEPWLLIKADDAFARRPGDPEIVEEETTSQLSGRTNDELAAEGTLRADHAARAEAAKARRQALPDVGKIRGARKALLPAFVEPNLASPCRQPPRGPQWVHEIKHDGYRIQARIDAGTVRLLTRKALEWTDRFRRIAEALGALGLGAALLDGEVVVQDSSGISSLNNLQADLAEGRQDRLRYLAFDLIYCEGFDLTKATLIDRKDLLQRILSGLPASSPLCFSEHLETDGPLMLEHSCRLGLEGIISKRRDAPYRPGRGEDWFKAKCRNSDEFIVLGYAVSTAATRCIGALLLGYHAGQGLRYAGRVGTGWSADEARRLHDALAQMRAQRPPLATPLPAGAEKGAVWITPRLVCEVEYRDWTREGLVRQASFKGMREDKPAAEVVLEEHAAPGGEPEKLVAAARLTHPDRILWAGPGITKQGLADFYADIAERILPHIAGRVLSLLRHPSGVEQKGFFAKHAWAGLTETVRRVDVRETQPMLAIDSLAGLIELVQAGVVEIHPWGSRVDALDRPDRLIFDLDPGTDVAWSAVIAAARETRDRLADLGLTSFVKTSGGKGLHVVVPVEPTVGWKEAKSFTAAVAAAMARRDPERYVVTMAKRARSGRIFIDYFRNDAGATAVAAYSTRALPQASVSTPLDWDELGETVRSDHFTVGNLRHRLSFLSRDPWPGFFTLRQRLGAGLGRRAGGAG